ncbi:MAG: hypothetical protein UH080_08220 [Ruminococcus sp.]|nr:hypothetical protein [Ruminococcus sp.]
MKQQAYYSSTNEMLQTFFSKPLTLVLAITFAFSALVQTIVPLVTSQKFSTDAFSICFALGFFMLYFKANSHDPFANYKAPLTLIKVTAIILTCLVGLCFILILLCIPFCSALETLMPAFASTFKLLLIALAALLFVYFIFNLGFSIFAGSMKKTYKTNTVKRTGSVLTGVSGILFIISCVAYFFVIILMAELILSAITEIFTLLLADSLNSTGSDITFTSLATTATTSDASSAADLDFSFLLTPLASFVNLVMTSIYALCYNSFMKKAEKNFVPSAPVPPSSNGGSASSFGFSSQPTTPGQSYSSSPASSYNNPARSNYGVPATMHYSRTLAPEIHFGDEFNANEDRRICPTCGSKVELALDFCPQCGFKFIIKEEETPVDNTPETTPVEPVVEPVTPAPAPAVEPVAPAPAPVAQPVAPAFDPFAPTPAPAVEPVAPAPAPVAQPVAPAFDPFAPAPAPVVEPVVPASAPVAQPAAPAFDPFAPTPAPAVEPVAPAPTPAAKPVAPAFDPFAPTPAPFNPTTPVEQPFVAPFQTVDTAINQPSVSEQPLVTPFFNSNMQPRSSRAKSKDADDAKPIIKNSNLKW